MEVKKIIERKDVVSYLEKRNLLKQYKKAKDYILSARFIQASLKKRKPKKDEVWYFRINKQYRALAYYENKVLTVFEIDNHSK